MYSGYWPPKDITSSLTNNNIYITNYVNNNNWILCDGGESITISSLPTNNNISYELSSTTIKTIKMFPRSSPSNLTPFEFTIPDLRGRFVLGCCKNNPDDITETFDYTSTIQGTVDSTQKLDVRTSASQTSTQLGTYTTYPGELNKYGGVMSQVITQNEMPSHTHGISIVGETIAFYHQDNQFGSGQKNGLDSAAPLTKIDVNVQGQSQQTGGNQYRSKLPPYWVLSYIMRIG